VHAALWLVLVMFCLAVFYVVQDAPFLGLVQVIVYAGAIMVLFVFVIMLLNAGEEAQTGGSVVAWIVGIPAVLVGGVLVAWVLITRSGADTVKLGALPGYPSRIAQLLFHDFLLPFEVTSILVLIAIMGAVVLAARHGLTDEAARQAASQEAAMKREG
jgi:NADH-quinone oxidoreductase subunit J